MSTPPLPYESPEYWVEVLSRLEKTIESHEQLIANLMMGYIESAVALEQCMNKIIEPLDEDERKKFGEEIKAQKQEMFRVLNKVSQEMNNGSEADQRIARAMENPSPGVPGEGVLPGE